MSRSGQPPDLKKYMDKKLQIKLNANRVVIGTLRGFDQFMNLVVDNTVEVNGNEKNDIGMVVIRGNSVVMIEALEPVPKPHRSWPSNPALPCGGGAQRGSSSQVMELRGVTRFAHLAMVVLRAYVLREGFILLLLRRRLPPPPPPLSTPMATHTQISKKRKFVADGVFFAELNEMLTRELAEDGYSGVEVRVTPMRTEIIIRATRTQNVLGEKGRRIRELTSVVQKRFNFPENGVELYAEKVNNRGLCAIAQAESLRYKLLGGLAVRRACYGVLRFVMESGAKGCEVIVSGKLRAQRAKSMKFKDGYMISSGHPVNLYIDSAVRHVLLRQGVLGIKVKIMLDWDPKGKQGPMTPLPDLVTIHAPKDEDEFSKPLTAEIPPLQIRIAAALHYADCSYHTASPSHLLRMGSPCHTLGRARTLAVAAAAATAAAVAAAAAGGALVLLDVLSLGRGDLDALAVEPLLADVAADPELVGAVALPARAAQRLPVLLLPTAAAAAAFLVVQAAFLLAAFASMDQAVQCAESGVGGWSNVKKKKKEEIMTRGSMMSATQCFNRG
uniref:Probable small nuclear ribonucleoprotein G n=1 Tax=Oryza meridionalis TaxID=40149 RepID=A0A0E0EE69_9ORYZ